MTTKKAAFFLFIMLTLKVEGMAGDIWQEIEGIERLRENCLSLSISDPYIKNLAPLEDNNEKLEEIFEGHTFDLYLNKYPRILPLQKFIKEAHAGHPSFSKARSSVIDGLGGMLEYLPKNIGIAVFEAYRPLWKQKEYHKKVLIEILKENSELSIEEAYNIASQRVSEFIDNIFAHGTGGAIDLTLFQINLKGENSLLDMGKFGVIFGSNDQKETFSNNITLLQRDNRLILQKAALYAGFVGYALEWWHYSLNDCAWAYIHKKKPLYRLAEEQSGSYFTVPTDKEKYYKEIEEEINKV